MAGAFDIKSKVKISSGDSVEKVGSSRIKRRLDSIEAVDDAEDVRDKRSFLTKTASIRPSLGFGESPLKPETDVKSVCSQTPLMLSIAGNNRATAKGFAPIVKPSIVEKEQKPTRTLARLQTAMGFLVGNEKEVANKEQKVRLAWYLACLAHPAYRARLRCSPHTTPSLLTTHHPPPRSLSVFFTKT